MPIYWTHIPKNKLILSVWQGVITLPDGLAHVDKLTNLPAYQQASLLLVDIQTAKLGFSLDDMQTVIPRYLREAVHPSRIAIVAPHPHEQVRHFEQICQEYGLNVVVFSALHLASTWLGLDLPETNLAVRRLLRKA